VDSQSGFFTISFFQSLVSNGLATLVGAFTGVYLAFWLQRNREKRTFLQRQRGFLTATRASLVACRQRVQEAAEESARAKANRSVTMGTEYIGPIDTTFLDATASIKYELVDDDAVNQQIDQARHVFHRINGLLELVGGAAFGGPRATGTHVEVLPFLYDQIVETARLHDDELASLIEILDNEWLR